MDTFHYLDAPTLEQFISLANPHGVKLKESSHKLTSPSGKEYPVKYLEREIDGVLVTSALPELNFKSPLDHNTLRQLCNHFQLPMKNFCASFSM